MADNESFVDGYLNILETEEGTGYHNDMAGKTTRPYGVLNTMGLNPDNYKDDPTGRSLAKDVVKEHIKALQNQGIDFDNLPDSMKLVALDIHYNLGSLKDTPSFKKALGDKNYSKALYETLDVITAYDPQTEKNAVSSGHAGRRARFYNFAAKNLNMPLITSVNSAKGKPVVTYNTEKGKPARTVKFVQSKYHTMSKPGTRDMSEELGIIFNPSSNEDAALYKPIPQNIYQDKPIEDTGEDIPIEDTGEDIPLPESKSKFPEERVIDLPPEEENKYKDIPFLRYKPVQKLLGLAEGGAVPMKEQMSMFEDGGLMDEGGTVDPVSGNDVPPGSTQEEVRDDIPAQLSEGEFVFPADVVRYIGLSNLMRMRQEAKMGLKMMDEMGQMGNSEEATMPDDLPFDINDLDMEDEDEYNTPQEFAVGGMPTPNRNTGVYYNPTTTEPTTGVAAVPQQAASSQYVQPVRPVQAAVPTAPVYKPAEVPTFKGFVGENVPGVDFEYVEYKDEAGNVIKLRKSLATGDLLDPVPEGYTFVDPEATKVEEATVTPTTPQTTTVREDKGDSDHAMKEEEMYGPGGGRLAIDGTIYGVSFDGVKFGEMRSLLGVLATGKPVPDNVTVNFKRGDTTFRLKGSEYNDLKNSLNTPEGQTIVNNAIDRTDTQDRVKAVFNKYEDALASDDKATSQNAQKVVNEMIKEAKRKNIDKDTGMIINQFEANRPTGDETQQTTTPSYDPTSVKESVDYVQSGYEAETSGDQTSQTTPDQDSGSSTGGYYDFNQGGLASKPKPKKTKKMKKGGLASKK